MGVSVIFGTILGSRILYLMDKRLCGSISIYAYQSLNIDMIHIMNTMNVEGKIDPNWENKMRAFETNHRTIMLSLMAIPWSVCIHNTYKKIKYSYQRATKHNQTYIKSNRDQIGSISNFNNVHGSYYRKKRVSQPNIRRHRSSTDPEHKAQEDGDDDEKKHNNRINHINPQWQDTNSQLIAS
eukprot:468716_1